MRRCWTIAPTSDQIKTDILAFPRVLDIIISVDGTVAPEISLRSGYRAMKHDKSGLCPAKVKACQRIETLKLPEIHEDAKEALAILSGQRRDVAPTIEEVVDLLNEAEIDPEESESEESDRNDSDSEGCFYVDESSRRDEDLVDSDFEEEDGNGDEGDD